MGFDGSVSGRLRQQVTSQPAMEEREETFREEVFLPRLPCTRAVDACLRVLSTLFWLFFPDLLSGVGQVLCFLKTIHATQT